MNTTSRLKESIESRTGNSRASQQRSDVFEEPNFLEIPESVQQRFESKGLTLRWVRVLLKGQDDYKNVGKRRAEGWEFVKSEDVPEMEHSSTVMETGRYVGAICRGDVALCHMSKARSESLFLFTLEVRLKFLAERRLLVSKTKLLSTNRILSQGSLHFFLYYLCLLT